MDTKDPAEPPDLRVGAVILAAGRGVRMRSATPKVLHPVGGIPMLRRALNAVHAAGIEQVVVVLDAVDSPLRAALPDDVPIAVQASPGGTADATRVGLEAFSAVPPVIVVLGGDTPLLTAQTIRAVLDAVPAGTVAVAAAERDDPTGYGRLVLSNAGDVERIVEEADASPNERALRLVNGMLFAFDGPWLASALPSVRPAANGELYLTALVEEAVRAGRRVQAVMAPDPGEIMGINTRQELADAETALRARIVNRLLKAGVTIVDPHATYIDETVAIGRDVVIHPQCYLRGNTIIDEGCVLGPGAEIIDSQLGRDSRVWWSVVEGAEIADRVQIGPYCRIRPGTIVEDDVALGSFAEVKNSRVGSGTQMHHFGYLGDAEVGANTNIGAGVVTCNFDGVEKHQTLIGAGAFIGSDTMLIAPVQVGARAFTGAGSVVNRDVPDDSVVVGVPARRIRSKGRPPSNGESEEEE